MYVGYSFYIIKCCFSYNDEFFIIVGGEDRIIL